MATAPSSAVRHLAYNSEKQELHVFFRGGGDYTYFEVPPGEYQALVEAPSKGAFLNRRIKGQYRCTRRNPARRRIWLDEQRYPFRETSA
jgi:hypothetical protein